MSNQDFFRTRQCEMSDGSELFEILTSEGERVASSTDEGEILEACIGLNHILKQSVRRDPQDFVVNN